MKDRETEDIKEMADKVEEDVVVVVILISIRIQRINKLEEAIKEGIIWEALIPEDVVEGLDMSDVYNHRTGLACHMRSSKKL
jgi:hypothetical protein